MTLEEAAFLLKIKPITLKQCFNRTKQTLEKKGVTLIKIGRGEKAEYYIKVDGELLD